MQPGDLIWKDDPVSGRHRFWQIDAVLLGATGQESVVKIRALDRSEAGNVAQSMKWMFVPVALVEGLVYTRDESHHRNFATKDADE